MKFVLRELLLQIIILIHFVSGISCTQVIEYSEKNALTTTEHSNRSFPLTISIENATIPESTKRNKSSPKRRRRIRRKRKRPIANQSTTVIPNFDFPTIVSTVNYSNDTLIIRTSHRRRKLKKRRKGGTRKRKGKIIATTAQTIIYNKLESKNLVLPIIPTQKSDSILRSSSTVAKSTQRMKQTRCMKNNGGCAHICNSRKIEKCQCFKGFTLANDRHSCTDINECLVNNGDCQMNCTNTIGSYRCQCPHGLRLNMDSKSCEDVNECLLRNGHGPCQDTCENTYGGYKCSCVRLTGTKLGNDLHSCVDVDECAKENGGCSHICINTFGRSFCSCPDGMELSGLKTCQGADLMNRAEEKGSFQR